MEETKLDGLRGILGTKAGMTQIFSAGGEVIPVTVVSAGPCFVTQVKTKEKDGYPAVQLGFQEKKESRVNKSEMGRFKKATVSPLRVLREFRVRDPQGYQPGQKISVSDIFKDGDWVDISGTTKGKGFAGVVKRHGFAGGPQTHGQSHDLRGAGSLGGGGRAGGRVAKGLLMAGHMGSESHTAIKLQVVKILPEKNALLVRGAVAGVCGGLLKIEKTLKRVRFVEAMLAPAKAKTEAAAAKKGPKRPAGGKAPAAVKV